MHFFHVLCVICSLASKKFYSIRLTGRFCNSKKKRIDENEAYGEKPIFSEEMIKKTDIALPDPY